MIKDKSYLSSLSCAITLGDLPIGGLQDFSFTENFNVKQINTLGRAFSNTFIPGFFNGEIRAKKVFIEQGMMTTALIHDTAAGVSASKFENGDFTLNSETAVNELFKYTPPSQFFDNIIYCLLYDFILYDDNGKIIAKIIDCIIDQRTTSVSVSNMIIMEDVVFKYKSIIKVTNGDQ